MKNKILLYITAIIFLSACKDKNPVIPQDPNEEELITTLTLIMVNSANINDTVFATFKDADGDGGNAPSVFDTIRLTNNTTYNVKIILLNESVSPADTISNEVEEEAEEHQFFYTVTGGPALTVNYTDADANSVPIGLMVDFIAGAVTTNKNGKLLVTLKHQPGVKPTSGQGNITLGATDIEINFPVVIN
jgi:hypothetical protein